MNQRHASCPFQSQPDSREARLRHDAIFPNEAAIVRLVGALLLEQNDEWAASRSRYMSLEKLAQVSDDPQAGQKRIAAA
jgi:transposase-like protein